MSRPSSNTFAPASIPDCTRLHTRFFASGEISGPKSAPASWPAHYIFNRIKNVFKQTKNTHITVICTNSRHLVHTRQTQIILSREMKRFFLFFWSLQMSPPKHTFSVSLFFFLFFFLGGGVFSFIYLLYLLHDTESQIYVIIQSLTSKFKD